MRCVLVTIQRGRHAHLHRQVAAVAASTVTPAAHVVVSMDAEAPDLPGCDVLHLPVDDGAPLPLARARNAGLLHGAEEHGADALIALDVDCLPAPGMIRAYAQALQVRPNWLLSGAVRYLPPGVPAAGPLPTGEELRGAPPHPARPVLPLGPPVRELRVELFWSLSFALTPHTHGVVGRFDERYEGYGAEDTDYGMRARRARVPFGWVGGAEAYHQHHAVSSPPVEHLADIVRNARRYHAIWNAWPMPAWLAEFHRRGLIEWQPDGGGIALAAGR